MFALENYIKECSNSQATIFCYLREMILSVSPSVSESVQNNIPVYDYYGEFCTVKKVNNGTLLSFCHGIELDDPHNDLLSTGPIDEKSIFFSSFKEIDTNKVLSFIKQACLCNKINSNKYSYHKISFSN